MKKHVIGLIIIFSLAFSGGCAVVPALVTTGASMVVPQTASMIITAASTVHKTVLFAADERTTEDILADKFLSLQAQTMLFAESGVDMEAYAFNGDLYIVGDFTAPADRNRVITRLSEIKGVNSVKGVVKQRHEGILATMEPTITDAVAQATIQAGLFKELHIKSANVDVEVVQGEAVVMGVVQDKEEADRVIDIVKKLRPGTEDEIQVTSLLAYQNTHEAGGVQDNQMYALNTSQEAPQQTMVAEAAPASKPETSATVKHIDPVEPASPAIERLYAHYFPKEPTAWQKARRKMKTRILDLAKAERDPHAKKELITLSSKVLKDKHTSIEHRLSKTLVTSKHKVVKQHVDRILDDIAPERSKRLQTLAMN